MIIPIRCFTCGKVIANKWKPYIEFLRSGNTEDEALNKLKIDRYCCRRMFISNIELIDKLLISK